jgi:hypothetical protein
MVEQDNEHNLSRAPTVERDCTPGPPYDNVPTPQMSMMVDAVTKGLEAALKNILTGGQFSPSVKHSPRRRRAENREVDEERAAEPIGERDFYLVRQNQTFGDGLQLIFFDNRAKSENCSKRSSVLLRTSNLSPMSLRLPTMYIRMNTKMALVPT